jgi:phosphatidylglycerol:prolipoprotein diacylglycerol transferase
MSALLAEAYLHRLDPFAIRFPAGWPLDGLRWYGLSYLAGFAIAWLLLRWLSRSGRSLVATGAVSDLMVYVVVGVLAGGRLGYCAFYDPGLLVHFESGFPWWGLLAIHRGGMASHGGMIGVIIALLLFARRHGYPPLHLLDLGAFAALPGLFLGRLANFVNGELPGEPLPASMQPNPPPWSVKYPDELTLQMLAGVRPRLIELLQLEPGVQGEKLLAEAAGALVSGDAQVVALLQPLLVARWPSQIFQALTDGPILMGFLAILWWRPRKPGVIGAWFLIAYGILRILTEIVRQPDPQVGQWSTALGAISRGQVLSVVMSAAGAVMLLLCVRRDVPAIGGLSLRRPRPGSTSAPPGSPGPASG